MSVSTLMIFSGAATPSSVVNLSIDRNFSGWDYRKPLSPWSIANAAGIKVKCASALGL